MRRARSLRLPDVESHPALAERRCDRAAARVRISRPHRAAARRAGRPVPAERRSRCALPIRSVRAQRIHRRRDARRGRSPTRGSNSRRRCDARSSTSTWPPRSKTSRLSRGTRARQPSSRSASVGSARCDSSRAAGRPPGDALVREMLRGIRELGLDGIAVDPRPAAVGARVGLLRTVEHDVTPAWPESRRPR